MVNHAIHIYLQFYEQVIILDLIQIVLTNRNKVRNFHKAFHNLILVEYLAMGRPVVANDHPDQSLVLQRSGGGLVVPFEVNAFGDAIVTLLEDAALREDMAQKGRDWILKNRSYPTMAMRVADIYRKIIPSNGL